MKPFYTFLVLCCFVSSITAQTTNPNYDAELAKKLGSDDYGMKRFVLVMLKPASINLQIKF